MSTVPSQITGLNATVLSSSSIYLIWNANVDATSYRIERSNGGTFSLLTNTINNYFTDSSLIAGTSYTYRVYGVNECGIGDYDEIIATTLCLSPYTPAGLAVSAVAGSDTQLNIIWTLGSNSLVDSYLIYRSTSGGAYSLVAEVNWPTNSYLDTGLSAGIQYCYKLKAKKCNVLGAFSSISCTFTNCTLPNNIVLVASLNPSNPDEEINLSWTAWQNSNATPTGYIIQQESPVYSNNWSTIHTASANTLTYTVTGLSGGTTYGFRVYATYTGCS